MQIFDSASAISQTLIGTLAGADGKSFANTTRVPFIFTSTRRLRLLGSTAENIGGEVGVIAGSGTNTQFVSDLQAFTEQTTPSYTGNELPVIEMLINPNSISWRQPKRIVKRDVQEGSVFFHFTNTKGENNDILTLGFRGNTGNINPRGSLKLESSEKVFANDIDTSALQKAIVWHNLWQLTREPVLLPDGTVNEFLIIYNSTLIPTQISLIGIFENTLEFTEDARKLYSRDYNFSFIVQETVPPIEDLINEFQEFSFDATEERALGSV
jgi:hypothetical protein